MITPMRANFMVRSLPWSFCGAESATFDGQDAVILDRSKVAGFIKRYARRPFAMGICRFPRRDRHRGDADHDAAKADPRRRRQALAEKQHAERNADRHAQIGLRRRADRSQRLDQPEIDHEGERGREHREAEQRQHRARRRRQRPGLFDHEADGNQDRRAAQQRARRRRHRIEAFEAAAEDGGAGIADRRRATVTICATNCSPNPDSACTPTIRQMPAIPATTPNSFRKLERLVPGDGERQEEREDRRRRN